MEKLNILPGFVPNDSFSIILKYNVKEVYCGFFDEYSEKKWPVAFHVIDRRGEKVNFYGIKEFCEFAKKAKKQNIDLYVTFNVPYTKQQINWIIDSIKAVSKYSAVKGIIVSDINILLKLKQIEYKKQIIASTLGTNLNRYAIEFYSMLGAKRFVLDRQLTAKEVINIIENYPQYKYEIFFLMGDGCLFIDGFCSSFHSQEIQKTKRYNISLKTTLCMEVLNKLPVQSKQNLLAYKCNICLIYYLQRINKNNITLKIPNRALSNTIFDSIMNIVSLLEKESIKKEMTFKKFHNICKHVLEKNKQTKCNPKVCLCRDLFV